MRSLILVLLLIPAAILPQNKNALALLDSVKAIYGNPCEIGIPSPLIERLRAYDKEYVVKDYLAQYDRVYNSLLSCTVSETFSGNKKVKLDKLHGREQNALNALFLVYQGLSGVVFDVVYLHNEIKKYYAPEYVLKPYDSFFVMFYSPVNDFYNSVYLNQLKDK